MIDIIQGFGFICGGFSLGVGFTWLIHHQHKRAWQSEYRRLMSGIGDALESVGVKKENKTYQILSKTYWDN
jgi:hypothetical protein